MDKALAIIARLGTDNPPTLSELTSARDDIARGLHSLRAEGSTDLAALQSLRESYQVAADAVTEAEEAAAVAADQVDELIGDIPNPDATDSAEETDDADSDSDEAEDAEPEAVAASATRLLPVRDALARLGLTQVNEPAPSALLEERAATFGVSINGEDRGAEASFHDLAHAFSQARMPAGRGQERRIGKISTDYTAERTLPGRQAENTSLIESLVGPTAVAAAGGCCSLATPIYDQPVLSSMARPIRDSLPVVGAPRGAVELFEPVCLPSDGVALWTCEQDELVDPADETTWKPCLEVSCTEKQTVQVSGIPVCVTIGNFQQRYSPEQWEGTLKALSALQARVAEVALFDAMRAGVTTTHTADPTGSVYVTFLNALALAAASMEQDQRYVDVDLHAWAPGWIRRAIRADLRARRVDDADSIEATDALITQALAEEGIRVTWSPDVDPIHGESGQLDGPLAPYPALGSVVLAPEGYYSFLDGGELDFGTEIRDHDLNRQNKLSAFAESFEGLLARGCNAKAIDIPVEVCDTAAGCAVGA